MELKKNPEVDLRKKSNLFMSIGLMISFMLINTAFEWKSLEVNKMIFPEMLTDDSEELQDIQITIHPPPPPPQVTPPEIMEVPDDEIIKDVIDIDLDTETMLDDKILDVIYEDSPKEEPTDKVHIVVEEQPAPIGGTKAFYEYISKHVKYPAQARRMGIEGKVFVTFVVERDGSLTDITVLKGIGAGCDQEALRVLSGAPKWKPGKQRGIPVKVRMQLPIFFKLN